MPSHSATHLDRAAYGDTAIHRLDPRAKILATLFFVAVLASFPKYAVGPLLIFGAYPLVLAILGEAPLRLILLRLLWMSPFVFCLGIFNPLLDRQPMGSIAGISVSAGWYSFASILLRFFLSLGAALVLVATTPFPVLCQALGRMRVPQALVTQMLFLYRYLFLLIGETRRMLRARHLRAGASRSGRSLRTAAAMLGVLFTRAIDRADAIYRAMLLRGFQGRILTLHQFRWRWRDSAFLGAVAVGCILFRLFPLNEVLEEMGQLR